MQTLNTGNAKEMDLNELSRRFAITDNVSIVEGENRIPYVVVDNEKASSVISLYGAQVLSFSPQANKKLLFLSKLANYQQGKSIKGGIPICWPWFGSEPENISTINAGPDNQVPQAHGFARNKMWELRSTELLKNAQIKIVLGLKEDSESLKLWPCKFDLKMEIIIGTTLSLNLITQNTDNKTIQITQALHSYFSIKNLNQVSVLGLENKTYLDKARINSGSLEKQQHGAVMFEREVDRIYLDVPGSMQIVDAGSERIINIASRGNKTAVVWNPGEAICKEMQDLENEDYQRFVCVETANAANNVISIEPGEVFTLSVSYEC